MRPAARRSIVVLGSLLHAVVLLAPSLLLDHAATLADPAVWLFTVLATVFYLADAAKDLRRLPQDGSRVPAAGTPGDGSVPGLALLTGLALLMLFWIALATRAGQAGPVVGWRPVAGSGMMLAGAGLRWLAIAQLGTFFITEVVVAAGQPLITDGVYRFLRHPSETGTLVAALGAATVLGSWAAAVFWAAVLVPLVAARVRREERVLVRDFADAYRRYQARTGGLVPKWPKSVEDGWLPRS